MLCDLQEKDGCTRANLARQLCCERRTRRASCEQQHGFGNDHARMDRFQKRGGARKEGEGEGGRRRRPQKERLHELKTERLRPIDVRRHDTRVVTKDEEIGPRGIEMNKREPADGDDSNPIAVDDEPNQTVLDPFEDLVSTEQNEQHKAADKIAAIVELLPNRQREERQEANIRREEKVLLNKRLAMMEGFMLPSRLIALKGSIVQR